MEKLDTIKELISRGETELAIKELDLFLQTSTEHLDQAYYLCGNAWRKQANWQQALNNYQSQKRICDGNGHSELLQQGHV